MHTLRIALPLSVFLALGASAQTNPLFISDNVMTGVTWHAAKTPGDGTGGSCALTPGLVQYFNAPFFTDQTADTYSWHLYYESYQSGYVYLYEDSFDPHEPCAGIFEFGLAPVANLENIHLDAGRQYFFVTSEAVLFGGGGSFQVTIEGPAGSKLFLGTVPGCGALASAQPYGKGKAGTSGVPALISPAPPVLGQTALLSITDGLPGAGPVVFAAGSQSAELPFDEGTLLVIPSSVVVLPALGPDGTASLALALPEDPSLCGLEVFVQGAFIDPGAAGALRAALTNGMHWLVGS